jgi:hypothetical protein
MTETVPINEGQPELQTSSSKMEDDDKVPSRLESTSFDSNAHDRIIFFHSTAMVTDLETNMIMVLWPEHLCIEIVCDVGVAGTTLHLYLEYKAVLNCLPKAIKAPDMRSRNLERRTLLAQFILKHLVIAESELNGYWNLTLCEETVAKKERRRSVSNEVSEPSRYAEESSPGKALQDVKNVQIELKSFIREKPISLREYSYQEFASVFCTIPLNSCEQQNVEIPSLRDIVKRASVSVGSTDAFDASYQGKGPNRRHTYDTHGSAKTNKIFEKAWLTEKNNTEEAQELQELQQLKEQLQHQSEQQQQTSTTLTPNAQASTKMNFRINFPSMKSSPSAAVTNNQNTATTTNTTTTAGNTAKTENTMFQPINMSFLPQISPTGGASSISNHPNLMMNLLSPGRSERVKSPPALENPEISLRNLMTSPGVTEELRKRAQPAAQQGGGGHIYDFLLSNEPSAEVNETATSPRIQQSQPMENSRGSMKNNNNNNNNNDEKSLSIPRNSNRSFLSLPKIMGGGGGNNPSIAEKPLLSTRGNNSNTTNDNSSAAPVATGQNNMTGVRRRTFGNPAYDNSPVIGGGVSQKQPQQTQSTGMLPQVNGNISPQHQQSQQPGQPGQQQYHQPRRSFEGGISAAIQTLAMGVQIGQMGRPMGQQRSMKDMTSTNTNGTSTKVTNNGTASGETTTTEDGQASLNHGNNDVVVR